MESNAVGNTMFDIKSSQSGRDSDSSNSTKLRVVRGDTEAINNMSVIGTIRKYPLIDLTIDDCDETDVTDKTHPSVLSSEAVNQSDTNTSDLCEELRHTQTNHAKIELITSENYKNTISLDPQQVTPSTTGEEKFATLTLEGCHKVVRNVDKSSPCLNCYFLPSHSGEASLCQNKYARYFKNDDIAKHQISELSAIDAYSKHPNTSGDRCMSPPQKRRCILPQAYPSSIQKNLSSQALHNRHQWPSQILMEQKRVKESDVQDPKEETPKDSNLAANVVFRSTINPPLGHREAVGCLNGRPVCENMTQSDRSGSNSNSLPKTCQLDKEDFTTPNNYTNKETYGTRCSTVTGVETHRTEVNQLRNNYKISPESKPVIKHQSGEPHNVSQNNKEILWYAYGIPTTDSYNCNPYKHIENNEYIVNIKPEILTNNEIEFTGQPEDDSSETSSSFSSFRGGPSMEHNNSCTPISTSLNYPGVVSTLTNRHPQIDDSVKQKASNYFQLPANVTNISNQNISKDEQSKAGNMFLTSRNTLERTYNIYATDPSASTDFRRTLDVTTNAIVIPRRPWHLSLAECIKSETSGTHDDISCNKNRHDELQSIKSLMSGTQEDSSSSKNLTEELHSPETSASSGESQTDVKQTDDITSTLDEDHAGFIKTLERQESIRRLKQLLQTKDAELSSLRSQRARYSKAKSSRRNQKM